MRFFSKIHCQFSIPDEDIIVWTGILSLHGPGFRRSAELAEDFPGREACLSIFVTSAHPGSESGAGAGVQLKIPKRKGSSNDVQAIMDSLVKCDDLNNGLRWKIILIKPFFSVRFLFMPKTAADRELI